jgi:hypothetical protein
MRLLGQIPGRGRIQRLIEDQIEDRGTHVVSEPPDGQQPRPISCAVGADEPPDVPGSVVVDGTHAATMAEPAARAEPSPLSVINKLTGNVPEEV